jgi:hypothetical protein
MLSITAVNAPIFNPVAYFDSYEISFDESWSTVLFEEGMWFICTELELLFIGILNKQN